MTTPHTQKIPFPQAWKSSELRGKQDLTHMLSDRHLVALDQFLEGNRSKPLQSITREDLADPGLREFCRSVLDELENGKGVAIIAGCTRERYSRDDFARIFWGVSMCLGRPVSQSVFGELMADVRQAAENPNNRTYRSSREIRLHNDTTDIIGLMCVQGAKSGGVSSAASALAIHNEILATRPELLEPLYRGFPFFRLGQQLDGESPITPYNVPVFGAVDGKVSCRYIRWLLDAAAQKGGPAMPDDLVEALNYFDEVAQRSDICMTYLLEPGEIVFNHNWLTLHARTEFVDYEDPDLKRHLLRVWLAADAPRPIVREMDPYQQEASGGRGGIAKREDRSVAA